MITEQSLDGWDNKPVKKKKGGLSFISNRQRRKEGTFLCVGVGGDRTHAGPLQKSGVCLP